MKTKQPPLSSPLSPHLSQLPSTLLPWYQQYKRDLPWRKTKDPYKIWLSEIMLQQTQVATVIDYYRRFLKKFPTLESLAKAEEQDVLTLWSGLGYYSRAKNLQKAAQKIVQEHQGIFPKDPDEMLKLPGIGPYTRGAIASIAFDLPVALVDGNVIRVYSRLLALAGSPSDTKFVKEIWRVAEEVIVQLRPPPPFGTPLLNKERVDAKGRRVRSPGDFNQALMELGATICTPKNPTCLICPIQKNCEGRLLGPENFPEKKKRTTTKEMTRVVWVFMDEQNKVSLINDPNTRWHKGLWQLPSKWKEMEPLPLKKGGREGFYKRVPSTKSPSIPLFQRGKNYRSLPSFTHHITHHKIKVLPYLIVRANPRLSAGFLEDVRPQMDVQLTGAHTGALLQHTNLPLLEALKLPLPAPDKKILKFLREFMDKGKIEKL